MTDQKVSSVAGAAAKFDNYRFPQKSVNLLDHSPSISYNQSSSTCCNLLDHTAFKHKYSEDLRNIAELEELINEADYYINTLYTYRSYSKPLPMIPADFDDNEKKPLYKTVFDILTPHINKVKGLMEFHDRLMKAFVKNLRLLVFPFERKEPLWRDHIRSLISVIDKFFVLDLLKDMKGQMRNDFSRYKRAFSFTRAILQNAGELMAQITEIHNFLNDPTHPNHIILWQLKQDVGAVPHREELFSIIINQCCDYIRNHNYCTPNEKHQLYRSILASIYLMDDNNSNINVFKSKYLKNISKIRDLCKKLPILPVFMDIHTTVPIALSICDNFHRDMYKTWCDKQHKKTYNLIRWRSTIQEHYISYTTHFVSFLHTLRNRNDKNDFDLKFAAEGFELVIRGMKLLGDWTSKILEQIVYKSANPIPESQYQILGGRGGKSKVYEQITRFNYSNELKYAMVEIIGLIKGLSNLLLSNETRIRNILTLYVHVSIQEFLHKSLVWPLQRSYLKKKENIQLLLLTLRLIGGDNNNIKILQQDYKSKKDRDIRKNISQHVINRRNVYPTRTQILLLRRILNNLWETSSNDGGLFKSATINKTEVREFRELYKLLGRIIYISSYSSTIKLSSDLSNLWYREFYLNMTDCIQFPIAMSLPWMLTDFAMSTPSLAPNVFFPLSIYNDCAECALSSFRQQHLFDEIEAEVNLVFDQLMFTLYRKIFDYYKNCASKILLDKTFQYKMRKNLSTRLGHKMKLPLARYSSIFNQKHVSILGRIIDIESLLTEQLNLFIRENIEAIINRYELNTITSVMEISHLFRTLKLTVNMLSESLSGIDNYNDILQEINEDTTYGSFRGRLFLTSYNLLFSDLLRNYIFNSLTHRFVSLDRPKGNRRLDPILLWGTRFTVIFLQRFKVTRGFFGIEHIKSIVELMGIDSMPLLVDETVKTVAHIIIRDISPYVEEILKNLDPMKLQNAYYGVLGVYGYYDMMLKYIKSYPALREGVFTLLREAGNALGFVQMLDIVLTEESYYNYQIKAFYGGMDCAKMPNEYINKMKNNNNVDFAVQDIIYSSAASSMNKLSAKSDNISPFIRILRNTLSQMNQTKKLLKNESLLLKSCIISAIKRENFLSQSSGGWLFSATLEYLHKNLLETGLLSKWKGPIPKNGILEHENPKDFSRFWSVATFIFLVPDYNPEEEEEKKKNNGYVDDRSYFGDGWLWAGTTILYLTNLIHRYRLLDPTLYLDKLQRLYPVDLNKIDRKKKGIFGGSGNNKKIDEKTEAYKPYVRALLYGWQQMERDQDLIISILKSHFQPQPDPITRFTPKWQDNNK